MMLKALGTLATGIGGILGGAVGIAVIIGLLMLAGPLVGAAAGWVVGWFFGPTILYVLAQMGLHGVEMWQLGMALGFVGGFFKAVQTNGTKAE